MTIQKVKDKLEHSDRPVAMVLHANEDFKLLVIGFRQGMLLKEHKAHSPTKLIILEGEVVYSEGGEHTVFKQYQEHDIPVGVTHYVKANADSICLLSQEKNSAAHELS